MTSFAERVARMQGAVFQTLGEDASWTGVDQTVRVRHRSMDDVEGFGGGQVLVTSEVILVRRSEVPSPAAGNIVTLAESGLQYRVTGDPKVDRKGRWICVVAPV
ncbi:hypothetical protein BBAL3_289 [Brevundimonas sp. BAL3]|uniref:head-tail joining protein n=1 Tax=Brevundimonas sp. BAL3 TaxID=391600 RepID=UPI00017ED50E|nr:hypothetical protein [Brevundimonas sp. BAL3]EDX79132.1 hypothetical protein BBAL3_289 [Brevundimonas sp. BAL3]